jgi:hypothetical protein
MASSTPANQVNSENVDVKSESSTSTDKMVIDKYIYDLIFNNIEPSNDHKVKVRIFFQFLF